MYQHSYQTAETTDLILTFPGDYPNSRTMADLEARWEQEAEDEWRMDQYIRNNFDECGNRFGELFDPFEDMAQAYDPGLI